MNNLKEKININFKKNKKYILAFLLIWAVVVSITLYLYKDTLGKESYGNTVYDYISYFYNNEINQEVDTIDGSKAISLFLSIQEKNGSSIEVKVIGNDSNTLYVDKIINDKNILNDSYNAIVLDTPLDKNKDRTISINVISKNENHNNLGIWYSIESPFGDNTLSINGETTEGNITATFLNDNKELTTFNNIIVGFTCVGGLFIILYMFLLEPKKECLFAILVIFLGLIYIVMIAPISGPDEDYHYKQTLRLSNKMMFKENISLIEDVYLDYEGLTTQTNNGRAYKRIIDTFDEPMVDLSNRPMIDIPQSGVYPYSLCYIPLATGVTIARIFKMNFINTYYLGRLVNLLFCALCVYISVKNTPVLKNAFGIVALFPMLVQQTITYSQDSWICALSMIICAFFLKWMHAEKKIQVKEIIFVLLTVLLLAPTKYVYCLFAILFVLIPGDKLLNKRVKLILVIVLAIPMLAVIGYNINEKIMPLIKYPEMTNPETGLPMTIEEMLEAFPGYSIRYIIMFPQKTINLFLHTIKVRLKTWVCTAIGRALSGGTLLIPLEIVYGFMAVSIAAALQKEKYSLNIFCKVFVLVICLGISFLVLLGMLIGWTNFNDEIIQGIQGRYFSPLIIFALSTINNKKITLPQGIDKYLIFMELLLSFETIINVLSFTFVN